MREKVMCIEHDSRTGVFFYCMKGIIMAGFYGFSGEQKENRIRSSSSRDMRRV
jgi:hypothetical protein